MLLPRTYLNSGSCSQTLKQKKMTRCSFPLKYCGMGKKSNDVHGGGILQLPYLHHITKRSCGINPQSNASQDSFLPANLPPLRGTSRFLKSTIPSSPAPTMRNVEGSGTG